MSSALRHVLCSFLPANGDHFLSSRPLVVPGTGSPDLSTNTNTEQGFSEMDQDLSGVTESCSCCHICLSHTMRHVVWDSMLRERNRIFQILRIFRTEPKLLSNDWFFKKKIECFSGSRRCSREVGCGCGSIHPIGIFLSR